jgi:pyruvate/2-oxoglutarate/acetoin dehydrogenase E1 component
MTQRTYTQAINTALHLAMKKDSELVAFGLGINDPKRIFGTTSGLVEEFGEDRVFDTPTSENTMTGVQVGLALAGIPSIVTHQRLDFFLLAMDQLVNSAAKWHFMFGSQQPVPITIRLIIGKGWGQGPTHSQALHAWFSHIPGLKVIAPSNPRDAKEMTLAAIADPNPVLILEHRWLHNSLGEFDDNYSLGELGKAVSLSKGKDVTVVSSSFLTAKLLGLNPVIKDLGLEMELLDLRSYAPLDWESIFSSVRRTGHLVVFDYGHNTGSIAGEIISKVTENCFSSLKGAPIRFAVKDLPEGTSFGYTRDLYFKDEEMVRAIFKAAGKTLNTNFELKSITPHDVPSEDFKGPF